MHPDSASDAFPDIPPFPTTVPTAPLLRISLAKLIAGDEEEAERVWRACCELGFFYLDLRMQDAEGRANGAKDGDAGKEDGPEEEKVDGDALLADAKRLFGVGEELFELPVEEKVKYDFKDQGSYFGYKGYGAGVIDKTGTTDRNEFYNVSKNDILDLEPPLPAPTLLNPHRRLLKSFITHSHAIVTLLLRLLNTHLHLPPHTLQDLHRLHAISGDQVRFIKAPPQPPDDRRTALGAHTDFGSVTVLFNRVGGLQVLLPESIKPVPPAPHDPDGSSSSSSSNGHSDKSDDASNGSSGSNGSTDAEKENWAYVRPLPGHCIVNLGDALVKFSAGVLRSNIHRVVSPPGRQAEVTRYSLVYFARPEDEVVLRRLEGSDVIDEMAALKGVGDEEVISAKDWVLRRALGRRGVGKWEDSKGTEEIVGMRVR